jgi:predicted NBD/HSP70 family sugar kinase/biotin operon repressor
METPGSQTSLHRANRERVLRAVRLAGSLTQAEIARTTGLSAATVSNIVRQLRESGTVEVTPTSAGGRRARSISMSGDTGQVAGIALGPGGLRIAVADLAHRVLAEETVPYATTGTTTTGAPPGPVLDRAADRLTRLLDSHGLSRTRLLGVGLGLPGPVDRDTGLLGTNATLPGWAGTDPGRELTARLGVPVRADNDANLGALGELVWGAGRGVRDLARVKVSEGVGAGLVLDGRLYRGPGGIAGELGHITVDESGPVCRCGNRGCLETFIGSGRLLALLADSHGPGLTPEGMVAAALAGDPGCRRVIADTGRQLAAGAAVICNLLNPSRLIVGGPLADAGDLLLGPLREALPRYTVPGAVRRLEVVRGELGERAEALGAVALMLGELAGTAPPEDPETAAPPPAAGPGRTPPAPPPGASATHRAVPHVTM